MKGAVHPDGIGWLRRDLDHVLLRTAGLWEEFRGASIFLTGGTGFFGHWLLHTLTAANRAFDLGASCVVLTRHEEHFRRRSPELAAERWLSFVSGDVRYFEDPARRFSHVIHAATPASAALIEQNPLEMLDVVVAGMKHVLEFSAICGARKLLFCSSGAVYGAQPADLARTPETYLGGPDPLSARSAYAEGKRISELMCAAASKKYGFDVAIARCFAFVGAYLPLDTHFAIGNFIGDAVAGREMLVRGDGTTLRSYMYAADLAIWLWTILARGASGRAYNVGAERGVSIEELARMVRETLAVSVPIRVLSVPVTGRAPDRYIPSTARAREELGLAEWIDLPDGIRRTAEAVRIRSAVATA